ncbi:DUF5074 domain-containing protein [Myroides sp. LJL119]
MKKINFITLTLLAITISLTSCNSDDNASLDAEFKLIPNDSPTPLIEPSGFYIANEGWYGYDLGSVNQITNRYSVNYNVFDKANTSGTNSLGLTTSFAGAYGDYYLFISKKDNRLVITDKKLQVIQIEQDILGDGRSFVGVSQNKVYISTSNGITILDISSKNNIHITGQIPEITAETGNMVYINNKVYAVVKGKGLFIIDTQSDTVEKVIEGNFTQVTLDRHGLVWAGKDTKIQKIDPANLQEMPQEIDISIAPIKSTWFAWNAGSLKASFQSDYLFWTYDNKVYQFNTQTSQLKDIHTVGQDKQGKDLEFYGAGLGINPVNDQIVLNLVRQGWGINYSYNLVRFITPQGQMAKSDIFLQNDDKHTEINPEAGYYWFPAMSFFEDNNSPEILINQLILNSQKNFSIPLSEIVSDPDTPITWATYTISNTDPSFVDIKISDNQLLIQSTDKKGKTSFNLTVLSNGKQTEKSIQVWIR